MKETSETLNYNTRKRINRGVFNWKTRYRSHVTTCFLRVATCYPFVKISTRILGKWNPFQHFVSSHVDLISHKFSKNFPHKTHLNFSVCFTLQCPKSACLDIKKFSQISQFNDLPEHFICEFFLNTRVNFFSCNLDMGRQQSLFCLPYCKPKIKCKLVSGFPNGYLIPFLMQKLSWGEIFIFML